jgi:hypothetical protein
MKVQWRKASGSRIVPGMPNQKRYVDMKGGAVPSLQKQESWSTVETLFLATEVCRTDSP